MIEIKNLSYTYQGEDHPALDDISLHISKGELVLLAGPTGSGKSTFLYCNNGLIPHFFNGRMSGHIRINGITPEKKSIAELSEIVGTVFQNPENQIFMLTVEDDVSFGCENLMMTREDIMIRREKALKDMGLQDIRFANAGTLSGGMKQRLAISSIYAMDPKVYLFDEPTADLDGKGRKDFIDIIKKLKKRGNTMLIAEHRYDDILPYADRIFTFKKGKIIEGSKNATEKHSFTNQVRACYNKDDIDIEIKDIYFGYNKKTDILKNINIRINKGELVAISGNNGSGKTTLLKIMAGILRPDAGTITITGIKNPSMEDVIGKVGFLFQNPDEQLFTDSVEDEVMFGPRQLGKKLNIEKHLSKTGLKSMAKKHPQTLSRGQRQLLALLSVLAIEPQVLLLDEPTTGLDSENWQNIFKFLREIANEGRSIIFSSHHPGAMELADRIITINQGGVESNEIP